LPPPPAPWRYWFETADEADDARPATQIVADVRAAMTDALEAQGATLASVGPDELLVTAVDFVSGPALIPAGRPDKTIVLRVRRKDLEDRRSGKISPEELRKRIDYAEY
jgi:hypothetical protein